MRHLSEGRRLFQCGYPKVRRLLEEIRYVRFFNVMEEQEVFKKLWKLLFYFIQKTLFRSSRSQMFFKIDVLKNFVIFTGKHLCRSLFLIKLQTWRPVIKKRLQHRCFPVSIAKILRTLFYSIYIAPLFSRGGHFRRSWLKIVLVNKP